MRAVPIAVLWAASVVAAFVLGSESAPSGSPAPEPGPEAPDPAAEAGPEEPRDPILLPPPGPRSRPAPDGTGSAPPAPPRSPEPSREEPPPLRLEEATTPEEASRMLMAHLDHLLAKGRDGHLEILRFLNDEVLGNEALERLFGGSDAVAARLLYPWVRYLVNREGQVVDLVETVYETMAERPEAFEGLDGNTLEVFTEGVSFVLPGAVEEERLERFRQYARAVLDTPESRQPEAVRENRRRIERVLAVWAPQVGTEEALLALREARVEGREALALLRRLPPEALRDLDLVPVLAPLLARGDWEAMRALRGLRLDVRTRDALDGAVLEGAADGRVVHQGLARYLQYTERRGWPAAQGFLERGLGMGGRAAEACARSFAHLSPRPPADYVRWVLDVHDLPEATRVQLRSQFGLR